MTAIFYQTTSLMILVVCCLLTTTAGWAPNKTFQQSNPWLSAWCFRGNLLLRANGDSSNNSEDDPLNRQQSDIKREQEMILEELSLKGADQISKMGIPERAKRAMLAEAVEDRIFELTDVLERLFDEDGSVPVRNREKVVEVATQTKKLQKQYSDLVNGKPSPVLTALDNMGKPED